MFILAFIWFFTIYRFRLEKKLSIDDRLIVASEFWNLGHAWVVNNNDTRKINQLNAKVISRGLCVSF